MDKNIPKIKKNSIQKTIIGILVLIALLIGGIVFLVNNIITAVSADVRIAADNYLELYCQNLQNNLGRCDSLFEFLLYDNNDYKMLSSESEYYRYMGSINIKSTVESLMAYNEDVDAIVISQEKYDIHLGSKSENVDYNAFETLKAFNVSSSAQVSQKAMWRPAIIGEDYYLYKKYNWNNTSVGVYILVDTFLLQKNMETAENTQIVLTSKDNIVYGVAAEAIEDVTLGETLNYKKNIARIHSLKEIDNADIQIHSFVKMDTNTINISASMIAVLISLLIMLAVALWLRYFLSNQVTAEMYEKQIEMSQAELKTIKLTLRPHFFLNALTTISSLSIQGENKKIQKYIDALSKNIRYMFKSGLHTVTVEEELRHVENYFEMQELKYPGAVFYFIECSEDAKQWKIPQMIIHTIIENEYKYGVTVDKLLTILIKVSIVRQNDKDVLLIEIQDDGKGYPEEFLESFNHRLQDGDDGVDEITMKDGKRVGLQSISRMLKIMYEDDSLFEISNIKPHGGMSRIYIPKEIVNEITE